VPNVTQSCLSEFTWALYTQARFTQSQSLGNLFGADRRDLRLRRRFELDDQFDGNPAPIFDLDALSLGPLANI
jgi:hypothetical protein